ncbi:MAG: class I SAM-dependent methyltransferase [Acidimicrobiales bacterium]
MPDALFSDPLLAQVYDTFDGDRSDLGLYAEQIRELKASSVLDVGCGTGSLAVLLARRGVTVTAIDPAAASLDVARSKTGAEQVTWIHGDAITLHALRVDAAVMTGNVAQVFLSDAEWAETLQAIRGALAPGGHLVFETRRPERRAWEDWAVDAGPDVRDVPGIGEVEQRRELTRVALPYVSFRHRYRFVPDGLVLTSESTLRFRDRGEIDQDLARAGFEVLDVRDAPDRPGREYVFVAKRTP